MAPGAPPEVRDVRAPGGSQAALAVRPQQAREELESSLAPPLPVRARERTRGGLLRHRVVQLTLADWSARTSLLRAGSLCFRGLFRNIYPFPSSTRSRDMSRKRQRLVPETLGLKRWRERGPAEADPLTSEAGNHDNPRARLKTPAATASPLVTLDVGRTASP